MRAVTAIDSILSARGPAPATGSHAQAHLLDGIDLKPTTIFAALRSLEEAARRLRESDDPRAVFPDVYAVITRNVIAAIEGRRGPRFLEPEWIGRLAGLFCTRYFDALAPELRGGRVRSAAWRIGFEPGQPGVVLPVEGALLGINAHINFDLAQGLVDNIRASGATDERTLARYRHDHDAVNRILRDSMPEIFAILADRYRCEATRLATSNPVIRMAAIEGTMLVLKRWRARVWGETTEILDAGSELAAARIVKRLDQASGDMARAIRFACRLAGQLLPATPPSVSPAHPEAPLPSLPFANVRLRAA